MAGGLPHADLRTHRWRDARGGRVGRPRPGAGLRPGADRRAARLGGGATVRSRTVPTDPRGLRDDAPLLDAWLRFHEQPPTPFTIPGHKQRHDLVGDVVAGDVPLYAGLDTMKLTHGVLADAEARAARLWGADVCRFSVGGATHANQAVALALGGDGDRVVVSRTLHRSLLLGLVLAGLTPVWVRPETDPDDRSPAGRCAGDGRRRARPPSRRPRRPRRGPVLRRHRRRHRRAGRGRARARRAARGRRGLGRALRLPSGPAPPCPRSSAPTRWSSAPTRRCRPGARPLWSSPAPTGSTRPGSTRCRGDRHHEPGRGDPRQHRRGPCPARARRRRAGSAAALDAVREARARLARGRRARGPRRARCRSPQADARAQRHRRARCRRRGRPARGRGAGRGC